MKINKILKEKVAVIVIDMQNDYVHDQGFINKEGLGVKAIQKTLPKIKEFLGQMRKTDSPIIHIQMTEDSEKIAKNLKEKRLDTFGEPKNWSLAKPESWGHDLIFKPLEGELVFQKNTYDIFSNPRLKNYLNQNRIETLIVLGGYTHACVDSSVRSALTHGYTVVLATDLVASPDNLMEAHKASLKTLTSLFAFGLEGKEIITKLKEASD